MTAPRIPLAAVLGAPISHSRSPALHMHWLETLGLAGHYVPIHVEAGGLREALAAMRFLGFVGCNVTIPLKEEALQLADSASDAACRIGAANLLTFGADGTILADNTDGYGFLESLRRGAPGWQAGRGPAAVFGAGGAARAVIAALLEAGVPEIRLANRTRARAQALADIFGERVRVHDWDDAAHAVDGAVTIVNASSLGMSGKDSFPLTLAGLSSEAVVCDLVYTPLDTGFLQQARTAGCVTVDGVGMLIHQAVPAFARFFGTRPEVDAAARAVVLGR